MHGTSSRGARDTRRFRFCVCLCVFVPTQTCRRRLLHYTLQERTRREMSDDMFRVLWRFLLFGVCVLCVCSFLFSEWMGLHRVHATRADCHTQHKCSDLFVCTPFKQISIFAKAPKLTIIARPNSHTHGQDRQTNRDTPADEIQSARKCGRSDQKHTTCGDARSANHRHTDIAARPPHTHNTTSES